MSEGHRQHDATQVRFANPVRLKTAPVTASLPTSTAMRKSQRALRSRCCPSHLVIPGNVSVRRDRQIDSILLPVIGSSSSMFAPKLRRRTDVASTWLPHEKRRGRADGCKEPDVPTIWVITRVCNQQRAKSAQRKTVGVMLGTPQRLFTAGALAFLIENHEGAPNARTDFCRLHSTPDQAGALDGVPATEMQKLPSGTSRFAAHLARSESTMHCQCGNLC